MSTHTPRGTGESSTSEPAARSRGIARRSIGSPILFTIVYSSLASAIYFSLGVIAGHALGLTPVVFLVAALLFTLTCMLIEAIGGLVAGSLALLLSSLASAWR